MTALSSGRGKVAGIWRSTASGLWMLAVFLLTAAALTPGTGYAQTEVTFNGSKESELKTFINDKVSSNTIIKFNTDGITFSNNGDTITLKVGNLTLRGANNNENAFNKLAANINGQILTLTPEEIIFLSPDQISGWSIAEIKKYVDALPKLTYIKGDRAIRTSTGYGYDQNNKKWIDLYTNAANSLSLSYLDIGDVDVYYTYIPTGAGGEVNTLIGNHHTVANEISMNEIKGSKFHDINITMKGASAVNYLAGGGVIGLRSTDDTAKLNSIYNTYFYNINVLTTGDTHKSPYIEGGGIIGVDAVSSPAAKPGHARLDTLQNNLFNNITVNSGDIILGGGVVGINNNSKTSKNTYALLGNASNNVFGNGTRTPNIDPIAANYSIKVISDASIRGGGLIGVNGLSNAQATVENLNYNIFGGILIDVGTSLKGGGIVGAQNNDPTTGKPNYDDPLVVTEFGAIINNVSNNIFYNIDIITGRSYAYYTTSDLSIHGGGIIGARSNSTRSNIAIVENNLFKNISILSKQDIRGGGIIGASAVNVSAITGVDKNYFDQITINSKNNKGIIYGGGIIGTDATDALNTGSEPTSSLIGSVENSIFNNLTVNLGDNPISLYGGGLIGTYALDGMSYIGDFSIALNINKFLNNKIMAADGGGGGVSGIYGGGLIGTSSIDVDKVINGTSFIAEINNTTFSGNTITANFIEGGGIVGAYSEDAMAYLMGFNNDIFINSTVTVANYIDGGGVLGATGADGIYAGKPTIRNSIFANNTIVANNGNISGGIFYSYGLIDGLMIYDSKFTDNKFTANYNTSNTIYNSTNYNMVDVPMGQVFGTITIDTANDNPYTNNTVVLRATSGNKVIFRDNIIEDVKTGNKPTTNSLYFGVLPELNYNSTTKQIDISDDYAADDAWLIIDAYGSVELYDPIYVNQVFEDKVDDKEEDDYGFKMSVNTYGDGVFKWGGDNRIYVKSNYFDYFDINGLNINFIEFNPGSTTQLLAKMELLAQNHAIAHLPGSTIEVYGRNKLDIFYPELKGTLWFDLYSPETRLYSEREDNLNVRSPYTTAATADDDNPALLTILTPADTPTDLTETTIALSTVPKGANLVAGDVIYYLINTGTTGNVDAQERLITGGSRIVSTREEGNFFKVYNFVADDIAYGGYDENPASKNKFFMLTMPNPPTILSETRILTDGFGASMGLLTHTSHWLADHSYQQADMALEDCACARSENGTWLPIVGIDGTWLETGKVAKVELEATSILAGAAYHKRLDHSRFFVAGFVEGAYGKYDIRAEYGTLRQHPNVHAEGDLRTISAGLYARQTFDSGLRLEASARAGKVWNEFDSNYLDTEDESFEIKLDVPFFAGHAGVGYEWKINELSTVDFVGRYYLTRQNGLDYQLKFDEEIDFEPITSHRVRAGSRYTRQKKNSRLFYYGGLYWEREFDGKAHASIHGENFVSDEFGGDTGVGEIGLIVKSNQNAHLSLEAGLQGYLGQNRGFSGGFRLNYEF
jgi:hypothetical protein